MLLLSLDGFNTNTMKTGRWVDQPSDQAHQTTTGPARGSEAHDEAILAAAPAAQGGGRFRWWAGEQLVGREAEGARCREFSGAFLHSSDNQKWMSVYWFYWEIPKKIRCGWFHP